MSGRPRVATVLSAAEWESNFSRVAVASSMIRLVDRLQRNLTDEQVDVVLVGAETPWLTPVTVASWKARGLAVIGVCAPGDKPGADLLKDADEVASSQSDPETLVHLARLLGLTRSELPPPLGFGTWYVTGSDGSPGRTEFAIGLATVFAESGTAVLMDGDVRNPSISMRMGVAPRPNICDIPTAGAESAIQQTQSVGVVAGSLGCCTPTAQALQAAYSQAVSVSGTVVIDAAAWSGRATVPHQARSIFVCSATPTGVIRAAMALREWDGPPPFLVVNRVTDTDLLPSVRAATGLEPDLLIPESPQVHREVQACHRAAPVFVSAIRAWKQRIDPLAASG